MLEIEARSDTADIRLDCARAMMDRACHLPLNLDQIASQAGFSRYHFIRLFRRTYGITPHQYLMQRRIEQAQALLASSDLPITEICFEVGFRSLGSFSALFHRYTGHSPSAHRMRAVEQRHQMFRAAPACFRVMYGGMQ
jgi:AraC-like DNA-binding protein